MNHLLKKFKDVLDKVHFKKNKRENLHFENGQVTIGKHEYLLCRALVPDIPEMFKLQRLVYPQDNSWDPAVFESELQNRKEKLYLILRHNDQLIAFIGGTFSIIKRDVHITNIVVLPSFQSQGIGSFLLKKLMRYAERLSFKTMSLEVRFNNVRAQKLYSSLGFKNNGLTKNYYHSNHEDAVNMKYIIKKVKRENRKNE
ncbi:ribosomal protein S18-alanine N-acetyltransferase [Liquorilactobacillus oeni]|uniref:Ribosomal-protein-alanine N-acetyltransferase n=1 Tax=Liquorilactobacillus oeni DSM 19972 TaxID=1423777 RepID=A0A0R1MLG3_9LACO|nr:ribosomal protein S18-alanine N-acetyltransferase [Liquorilactobacillus oeni]KRL04856.1 ribosomal-protein-alanine N-acetyltransferase [Liquorilactobacillus oeni DSM 19972]